MLKPYSQSGVPVARQEKILEHVNTNPHGSYVFSGPPGVGKTTLLHEVERLARVACPKNFGTYSRTATQYQNEATAVARGESVYGFIRPKTLVESPHWIRWAIFLDDLDKITGTEFIRVQLHDLIDAVVKPRTFTTQLVMTTNMNKPEFSKFFGDAIAWRVFRHCLWVPLEREKEAAA